MRSTDESLFNEGKVKHSKIFDALNPQPLAFQTARDRAERQNVEEIGFVGIRGYAEAALANSEEMESFDGFEPPGAGGGGDDDDEEEAEEPFDPRNLPDFGDFTEEMMARRAQRAAEEEKRRERLRQEHAARKAKEAAEMEKEMAVIRAREEVEAKKKRVDDSFVVEAQKRLESELNFGSFKFF